MASAASSEYECPVCHEDYADPKILPCGHLVCRKCVLSWLAKEGASVACPLCRAPILLSMGDRSGDLTAAVDALPTDWFTVAVVESQRALQGPHVCTLCDQNTTAGSYCLQCSIKLCTACTKAHRKIPATKTHSLEDLSGLSAPKLAASHQVMCKTHPDRLAELYCPVHQEIICILCGTTGHGGCTDRKSVADAATKARAELEWRVEELRIKEGELSDQAKSVKRHYQTMHTLVKKTIDDLHRALEAQRKKLDQALQAEEDSCMASLPEVDHIRAALTQNVLTVRPAVRSASGETLLQMFQPLSAHLDNLRQQAAGLVGSSWDLATFFVNKTSMDALKRKIAGLGSISKGREVNRDQSLKYLLGKDLS